MKKVLTILPEDPIEAFHQINNFLRISALFKNASFTVFCTREVAPFFKLVHPEAVFVEYEGKSRALFSKEFDAWGREFSGEEFGLCLMLERRPDISLLYLAGKTAAPVRAGYFGAGEFPFLNMQVNPSPKRPYRADQNALMANVFGASDRIKVRWSVSKETTDEIAHMARELAVSPDARIIGVDVGLFVPAFGAEWTRQLCAALSTNTTVTCLLVEGEPSEEVSGFCASVKSPLFSNLSASRWAAIIVRSACIISGKSVLFELANLLGKPVVGVFEKDLCDRYCRECATTWGIPLSRSPGQDTIQSIADAMRTMDGKGKM